MFKEPQNWWSKIIISAIITGLVMIIMSLIYSWIKPVNWYSLIAKPYSGWIALTVFIIVWSIQKYRRRQEERKRRKGLTKPSSGSKSIFGTFEEHEGKYKRDNKLE